MATIISLPDEVIDIILGDENVSIKDVVSFKSTCKKFHEIIHSKKVWEKKFYQRCPSARKKYNTEKRENIFKHLDFKEKIKANIKCIKSLQHYAHLMLKENLSDTDKKKLGHLLIFIAEDSMTYYFVLDEINTIIISLYTYLRNLDLDLDIKYNFDQINCHLRQYRFIYKLNKFLNMPKEKRLFERYFIIIVAHFQPCVSYSVIETFLDDLAHEVLSLIKNKYPKHSIFSTSLEQISFWRDNNIERNFWNLMEAKQIIEILDDFIECENFKFKLSELSKTLDTECKYIIDYLNNEGFLSTIIYQCVARRLGIYCCSTFATFRLNDSDINMWKPKFNIEDMVMGKYYFKDCIHHSHSIMQQECNVCRNPLELRFCNAEMEWTYNELCDSLNDIKVITRIIFYLCESLNLISDELYKYYGWSEAVSSSVFIYLNQWFRRYDNIKGINIEAEYINITESIQDRNDPLFRNRNESWYIENKNKYANNLYEVGTILWALCTYLMEPDVADFRGLRLTNNRR